MNYYEREKQIALGERERQEIRLDGNIPPLKLPPIKTCGCSRYEHCQRCVEEGK